MEALAFFPNVLFQFDDKRSDEEEEPLPAAAEEVAPLAPAESLSPTGEAPEVGSSGSGSGVTATNGHDRQPQAATEPLSTEQLSTNSPLKCNGLSGASNDLLTSFKETATSTMETAAMTAGSPS